MATPAENKRTNRIITVFFLIVIGVIFYMVAPLFLPVWRWQHLQWEPLAEEHGVTEEKLRGNDRKYVLRYNPRAKEDPLPWQVIIKSGDETPEWVTDPDGDPVDEYQTLVRAALINDRTGEPPGEMFLGGTKWDKFFRAKAWRFKPGSLGQKDHTRPVFLYQGSTFEKMPLSEVKGFGPWIKQQIREGEYIEDDDPRMGFHWRTDPFGERLLYGPTEEELEAERAAEEEAEEESEEE